MVKRSDFAQKLLDDLKLRKERLASQSSRQTYPTIADAYAHARNNYRGSKELTTTQTTGFRIDSPQNRYGGDNRSFTIWEDSKQIVPIGKRQSSEQQIGDLSMALAFAMENGRKPRRTDSSIRSTSVMGFLHQLSKKLDRHQPSTSHFSTFSQVQVKEISKGAQNLNQILRACSNRLNLDTYSIEIGKELLKGAVDLEESIRMLVNLQEASEYMISPQQKNRIMLLEEDEEEEEEEFNVKKGDQRQLDRPLFSFDKSSRSYQEVGRNDLKLKLATLSYLPEGTNKPSHHRRTASCNTDVKTIAFSLADQKINSTSSKSNAEKGRIPNVIAKLMGLDELPGNAEESTKKATKRTADAENMAPPTVKQKVNQANKIKQTQNTVASEAKRVHNASLEGVSRNEIVVIKPEIRSKNSGMRLDKQQGNINQLNHETGILKDIQEQYGEEKGIETGIMSRRKKGLKEGVNQAEITYTNKLHPRTQHRTQCGLGSEQPQMPQKSEPREEKHQAEEKEQHGAKQKFSIKKERGSESIARGLSKALNDESYLQMKQASIQATTRRKTTGAVDAISKGSNHLIANIKASIRRKSYLNTSQRDVESRLPLMGKKSVHEPGTCKVENIKSHKQETSQRINDVIIRREGNMENFTRKPRQQNQSLKDGNLRSEKLVDSKEANRMRTSKSPDIEAVLKTKKPMASIQLLTETEPLLKEAQQPSTLCSPVEDENQNVKELQPFSSKESDKAINPAMHDRQSQEPIFMVNEAFKSDTIESNLQEIHQANSDTPYLSELKYQENICKPRTPEPLTESENHLKEILIKSQKFLNTAEALFKLNIPFGILHGGCNDCQEEASCKLILDCGYEIMKRTGKRQELRVHPFFNISVTLTKVKSLNELVKQMHNDLQTLEFYGRNGNPEAVIEDYLPRMLENDLYNKNPDVNCMWELNWEETTFAFLEKDDVIRDVEKFILNGLLDEITLDLLPVEAF